MGLAQELRELAGELTEREVIGVTFDAIDSELHNVKLFVDKAKKASDKMKVRDLAMAETHAEYLLKTIRKVMKSR